MSWFFAYFGKNCKNVKSDFADSGMEIGKEFIDHSSFITAGGNPKTLFYEELENQCWVASGVGIVNSNTGIKLATEEDWHRFIKGDSISEFSGHYAYIFRNTNEAVLCTDRLGLRDLYYSRTRDGLYVSTRPDLLTKFISTRINFNVFSSRWLLFNQISHDSIYGDFTRLVAGKGITINLKSLEITDFHKDFNYPTASMKSNNLEELLLKYLSIPKHHIDSLSLSLSGGMDSRVLLSLLMNKGKTNWDIHSFGPPDHPDNLISQSIANKFGLPHTLINTDLPSTIEILNEIKEYTSVTLVNNPASAIKQLRNYKELAHNNKIIVDGGFGEIWRREFLFKLQVKGRKAIMGKNLSEIKKQMLYTRADIFNNETNHLMEKAVINQLESLIDSIPEPGEIGINNWIDFLAIKTRLPNYYGHEQNRLDEYIISLMPFAQTDILESLFACPINKRRNGKLFREIIKTNCKPLTGIPLVKGKVVNPFFLTSLQSRIFSLIRNKFKKNIYTDNSAITLLHQFREYIYDTINTTSFKKFEYYDQGKINRLVDEFYSGNEKSAHELDWFLSFELFRQGVYKN